MNAVDYGFKDIGEFLATNHKTMCRFIQIEHISAVRDLDNIMKNEFIDGYIIGANDLSGSIGQLGDIYGDDTTALIKETISKLATKKYRSGLKKFYATLNADMPDEPVNLVLMFVNPESALSTAIAADATIVQEARQKNIALVSVTTLISTLQIIESLWTNYTVQQSNEEIKNLAEKVVLELGRFVSDYKQLGKHLQNASSAYESTIATVGETNKAGLLLLAQQLADLCPTADLAKADKKVLKDTGFDGTKKNAAAENQ